MNRKQLDAERDRLMKQEYLGDGLYARFDGIQILLEAERDGMTHMVALETDTFNSLVRYNTRLQQEVKAFLEAQALVTDD